MLRLFSDRDALLASLVADWANDRLQVPIPERGNSEQSGEMERQRERPSPRWNEARQHQHKLF